MPFTYDPNLDDDENEQAASHVQITGAAPTVDSSAPEGGQKGPEASQNTGSGFQNIDKYLQTNQAPQFANQVAGKVEGRLQNAQNDMSQASDNFYRDVHSRNQLPNSSDVDAALANPGGVWTNSGTGANGTPEQFQTWENQTYEGPHNLAESQKDYNQFWSGTNQASNEAKYLGTEPGRFSLLDSYFGKPTYNFGQKSLDNLLIQQGGIGDQTKALQDQAAQLKAYGNQQTKTLQDQATQRASQVDQSRNQVRKAIGIDDQGNVLTGDNAGAIGKSYQGVDNALLLANQQRTGEQEKFKKLLGTDQISSDDIAKLGLSGIDGLNLYDVDASQFASYGGALNKDQVMTPEQRSRIQALSKLAGITDTYASGNAQDRGAAYGYDLNRLKSAVNSRAADYHTALTETPITMQGMNGPVTQTLSQAEDNLRNAQTHLGDVIGGQAAIDQGWAQIAAARAQLDEQYKVNRRFGTQTPKVAPKPIPRPAGPGPIR